MTPTAPRKKHRSLATCLTVAFATLLGLLTVMLVGVIGVGAGDQVRRDIGENLAELARQTADKLDRGMFERYREVRLIARRYDLRDHAGTRRFLSEMQASYPYYAWIGVTDLSGKVLTSTNGVLEGANVGARPWFMNAYKGAYIHDVHDAVLLARLLPNPDPEPLRFVDVAYPYTGPDGRIAGVLGTHLSWQWAREVARSIIKPRPGLDKVQAFIVDRNGDVLLGPPELERKRLATASSRAGGSGSRVETWPDGRQYLVGYASSEGHADYAGLGWKILVRQDIDSAFRPVEALQRKVLFSGMAMGLVFSFFGVLLARYISRPLQALSDAAERIGRGEAAGIPRYDGRLREVCMLTEAIAGSVAALRQKETVVTELNQSLEKRVSQRTAELAAALEQVRASEARIYAILETSNDAFVGVDLAGRITDWNSSAELLFGLAKDDVMGKIVADLIVPERLRERFRRRLAEVDLATDAVAGRMELTFHDSRGREFPVETSVSLTGDADQAFFSAFLHDISERKEIERMKNEFISITSHELRTPITAIRFSLGMLADGTMGELEPDVKKLIVIANDSCERLVRLINDMLDLEKIESGQMEYHFAQQPLVQVAQAALEATHAFGAQYQVDLTLETDGSDPVVVLDRDRMTQVIVNLLSNAVKFSRAGGSVEVRVATALGRARLEVIDHGEGIPMEFRPRIFGKFAQADGSNTRQRSGTGLGLSICKQLVEAHQGRIDFDSTVGEGTTFQVVLPLAAGVSQT